MGKRKQGEAANGSTRRLNLENLRNIDDRPAEEALKIRQMGAEAGRKIQARRRSLREIYEVLLQLPASDEMIQGTSADDPIVAAATKAATDAGVSLSLYDAIALAQAVRAARGDTGAAAFVRDSAGDKPTDKQQVDLLTPEDAAVTRKLAEKMGISID